MDWRERLGLLAAALWWGSLTAVGSWVVPLLFMHLPTPALAGQAAARLFTAQAWAAVGCGLVLLMSWRTGGGPGSTPRLDWANGAAVWLVAGVLLALLVEFGVSPRIMARENLRLWHAIGSAMYALQWVCATVVLWKLAGTRQPARQDQS